MRLLTIAVATAALLAPVAAATPAGAGSVVVGDNHADEPAAFAIKSVKFTNGNKVVKMRANTPDLDLNYVEWATFTILTSTKSPRTGRPYARHYDVSWDRDGAITMISIGTATSDGTRDVTCKGLRARLDEEAGEARFSVPVSCLKGGSKVQLGYKQGGTHVQFWDAAPSIHDGTDHTDSGSGQLPTFTRWIKRG